MCKGPKRQSRNDEGFGRLLFISVTSDGRTERDLFVNVIGYSLPVHIMQGLPTTPLTPPPPGLTLAHPSSPWKVVRSMLGFVLLVFIIVQVSAVAIFAGILDSDLDGDLGPSNPLLTIFGSACLIPCVVGFTFLRRPRLTHVIRGTESIFGRTFNMIAPHTAIQSSQPIHVDHHLVRDLSPLEMPPGKQLWWLFFGGVSISTLCMFPMLAFGLNIFTGLLFGLVAIPAFVIGFSTPVFAWWSTLNAYFGLPTTRRLAEWMLIVGMLSALPAVVINSFLSPILFSALGFDTLDPMSLGFGMILFLSAPIGEELCKAAAILVLARFIDSPRRGFQIGFTVGLGFALLENSMYVLMAFFEGEYSAISFPMISLLRGIGSIPAHGLWTGISGYAIGSYLCNRDAPPIQPGYQVTTEQTAPITNQWMLVNTSGEIVKQSATEFSEPIRVPRWLCSSKEGAFPLPKKPIFGIGLAMLFHSFWNGSSWLLGVVFIDANVWLYVFFVFGWLVFLIVGLWLITRKILPTALS
jgi:RsiW-degrading membrane proteinase PrsW (M82 family)